MSVKLNILASVALSLVCTVASFAQNTDEIKKEINKIKKSSRYIYAEATSPTEEEAQAIAEEILYDEVNEWAATQRKMRNHANLLVNNKKEYWTCMSMPRGSNMFRYFIYVEKSDIIATDNTTMIKNEAQTAQDTEAKSVVQPLKMHSVPDVVKEILTYTEYEEMASKIMEMKDSGRIKSYARYASLSNPDSCYLVIYDRQGKVVAILTPGTERVNVATGNPDGIKNYSGCGAIGFEI